MCLASPPVRSPQCLTFPLPSQLLPLNQLLSPDSYPRNHFSKFSSCTFGPVLENVGPVFIYSINFSHSCDFVPIQPLPTLYSLFYIHQSALKPQEIQMVKH
ncbi:hypothetical protein AMECASPLE_000649 [Ameca splendens]|uniref:Uncharacterized protein n=1 Tax=Ameca splendens TaxID=208324 RepID=A0ABV0XLT0_9TELE